MAAKHVKPKTKTELPAPSERELTAGNEAVKRRFGRHERPEVAPFKPDSSAIQPTHDERVLWQAQLLDAFGSPSHDFMTRSLSQLSTAMQRKGADQHRSLNAGLAVLGGLQPENEIEAMLAIQMVATHDAAMEMLATAKGNTGVPTLQICGNLAVKLLRTYVVQAEALAKMRRGGEQTVRVEHVHVHPGAQAIVGSTLQQGTLPLPGGGGPQQIGDQPHASIDPKALAYAPVSPLWSEDQAGDALPIACGEREETL